MVFVFLDPTGRCGLRPLLLYFAPGNNYTYIMRTASYLFSHFRWQNKAVFTRLKPATQLLYKYLSNVYFNTHLKVFMKLLEDGDTQLQFGMCSGIALNTA